MKWLYFISGCVFFCLLAKKSVFSLLVSSSMIIMLLAAVWKTPGKVLAENMYVCPPRLLTSCGIWACLALGIPLVWKDERRVILALSAASIFFILITINFLWDKEFILSGYITFDTPVLEEKKKKWQPYIIFLMACIIACMKNPTNPLSNGETSIDQSVFRYVGWVMSEGGVPYRDTFDHKGPFLYFIYYLGSQISFEHGIWLIGLIFLFLSVVTGYRLARLSAEGKQSFLSVIAAFTFFLESYQKGNMVEEWALPFLLVSLYIFMDYFLYQNISVARIVLCGFSFACVSLLRINMISVWIVFSCMVLIQCIREKKLVQLAQFILEFVLGMAAALAPAAVYLFKNHGVQGFIDDYIIFNLMYSSDSVRAGWLSRIEASAFYMDTIYLASAIAVIVLLIKTDRNPRRRFLNVGYLLMMFMTVGLMTMSGQHYAHYGIAFVPMLIYPYSVLAEAAGQAASQGNIKKIWKKGILLCMALLWILTALTPLVGKEDSPYLERIEKHIEANSDPNDRIIVFGNKDIIYLKTRRFAASQYSYQIPIAKIDKEIMGEFIAELEADPPKIVVKAQKLQQQQKDFLNRYPYECVDRWEGYAVYHLRNKANGTAGGRIPYNGASALPETVWAGADGHHHHIVMEASP